MKKIAVFFITFVLMINIICNLKVIATEENSEENIEENEITENVQNPVYEPTKANAVVVEIGEIKEYQTDHLVDKVQEIKIEILDGKYKAKQITTEYVVSYDLDEKIKSSELKVGDKIIVEIVEAENQNLIATIQDVSRNSSILICFIILLLVILLIGNKEGIKAIGGLLVSLLIIYFILIKGIFAGNNVILMTILTSVMIICINAIIISGINKRTKSAILGSIGGIISCGILASIFTYTFKLSGLPNDIATVSMNISTINFAFKDLLFAGIVISSLRNVF